MSRGGYLKWWRCAEDSSVWSRGIEYRGLFITLLTKASYIESSFGGVKILPGQVACSIQRLANDLGISRDKLNRMLRNLQKDGAISAHNSHNRYTIITICNFMQYQKDEGGSRTTDALTNHTTAAQPPHTLKEGKNIYSSSLRSEELSPAASASDSPCPPEEAEKETPEEQKSGFPLCPHQKIIALYHEALPELPRVKVWNGTREKHLASRWKETLTRLKQAGKPHTLEAGLEWWRAYFAQVRASSLLMGKVPRRDGSAWVANLEWLVTPKGYAGVLEGKYLDRRPAV